MPSSATPQESGTAGAREPRQAIDRPGLIVSIAAIADLLMSVLAFSRLPD